jgi:S-adenosylmethionine decarboxylase
MKRAIRSEEQVIAILQEHDYGCQGPQHGRKLLYLYVESGQVGGMDKASATLPGQHLLLDFHQARTLTLEQVETCLHLAARAAGARVLQAMLHPFPGGGVTGVLLLAESHISIHTWPEQGFVALDVFLCGAADPEPARKVLEQAFAPERVTASLVRRG